MKANNHNRWREHQIVLLLYTLLALILSWPLITKITTHVPGAPTWAFDESTFLWNIWYFKHSLIDQQISPLHSDLIWHPLGIDLILYTYNFFHVLVAQPLAAAVNLPFASNIALLLSTILSGYGTFLLVSYLLKDDGERRISLIGPAFVAGIVYAFASNRAIYATLGHYDMVTTQWIPFYALMLLRSLDEGLAPARRRRAAMLAGVFFAFTGLAEMISALFLGIFTLIVLLSGGRWRFGKSRYVLLTGLVAFLLWSPVLVPVLRQFLTEDFSLAGWGEAIPLSTDLLGWFTPTVLHPLFGGDLVAELRRVQLRALAVDGTGLRDINTVFLGWVTLALAVIGAIRYRRQVQIWLWTALIFGIFTLGPFLQINGRYRFDLDGEIATMPLPFALLHYLPIIKANRAPNRNSVLLMLGIAVLVGYACYWLFQLLQRKDTLSVRRYLPITTYLLLITSSTLILFEHFALPLPLSDARIPTVHQQIAADPRPISVIQIPLGWRNSFETFGPETTLLQYYQAAHGKPMIGGNISRAPAFKMEYFRRLPFFQALTEIESGRPVAPEVIAAARSQAPDLMRLYNVGYVIFYPPIANRFPYVEHWQASWDFVKSSVPLEAQPFWTGDGIEAYRVIQPAGGDEFRLDLGAPGTFPYRGDGWDQQESDTIYELSATWATAQSSELYLPLQSIDATVTYSIALRLHPFAYPGSAPQRVRLLVNEVAQAEQPLRDEWQTIEWPVPGSHLREGLNRLRLEWATVASPRQVIGGNRQIGATGVELPIDASLKSFADGAWMALIDEVGAQIDASSGRQGVNVTVLDPATGAVIEKRGFDTAANQFENQKLVEFMGQIAPGQIILVATRGAATQFFDDATVERLRALGAGVTLAGLRDQYLALVGVQGAAVGTAALSINPTEAGVTIQLPQDRRSLAAAVDWVEVGR